MRALTLGSILLPFVCCLGACATLRPFTFPPGVKLSPYCAFGDNSPLGPSRRTKADPTFQEVSVVVSFRVMPDGEIRDVTAKGNPNFPELDALSLKRMSTLKCEANPVVKSPLGDSVRMVIVYCRDLPCPRSTSATR
jgi:hypothetical protein